LRQQAETRAGAQHDRNFQVSPILKAGWNTRPPGLSIFLKFEFMHIDQSSEFLAGVVMGSRSDWTTMRETALLLEALGVPHEARVVSAHRTPDLLAEYAKSAETRGLRVIIAGAGGAAHLPGMLAAHTHVPVLGVPVESRALHGQDSLLSIVQMPAGIPVATFAIGVPGAKNAALFAAALLAPHHPEILRRLLDFRKRQTADVLNSELE
jgi:5-(carboxyamino)imidazole ribonucleotide mutase